MVQGSSRALLDAYSAEWIGTPMEVRVHVIKSLEQAGLLEALLREHIREYLTDRSHVLTGLGAALRAYREAVDLLLEVPAGSVAPNPNAHPIYVAAVAQLLEQNRIGRPDYSWLVEEVERLGHTCINWLEAERQRIEMGMAERAKPSGTAASTEER